MTALSSAEAIRLVRKERGMTQAELAKRARLSRTQVLRIEREQVGLGNAYQWIVGALGFTFGHELEAAAAEIARKRRRTRVSSTTRRKCAHCGRRLPTSAFRPNPKMSDGLDSYCRECHVDLTRRWRAKNADAINVRKRAVYRRDVDAIKARRRARYPQLREAKNARRRKVYAQKKVKAGARSGRR
jgi:transcriptional regulator with XRE-family HTH domain